MTHHLLNSNRRGFTLIELSIVLVIIGLITGGILIGRELIHTAQLRGFVTQIENYNSAINTFRVKYNCLPGDCTNESRFFAGTANGDGNGLINDRDSTYYNGRTYTFETGSTWDVLSQAGLISGTYAASSTVLGTGWPLVYGQMDNGIELAAFQGVNYYVTGTNTVTYAHSVYMRRSTPSFMPAEAYYITSKISDGTPTGAIKVLNSCTYNCFDWQSTTDAGNYGTIIGNLGANNSTICYSAAANAFNVANARRVCNLGIPASF